jgi:hypothetical protein
VREASLAFLLLCLLWVADGVAGEPVPAVDIQVGPDGTAHVSGRMELSGTPAIVVAVLTDYAQWPSLFGRGFRLASIRQEAGRVVTEQYVPRHVLPGEMHLVTETRETAPGRLETSLIEGDFLQYSRVWQLQAAPGGTTHAALEMYIRPKAWLPHWLFSLVLRRELLDHFARLQAAVVARGQP